MNTPTVSGALAALRFDNRFVRDLPADPETGSRRRQVEGALYSRVEPTPVRAPQPVACAPDVAELIGLSAADCATPAFAEVFTGNRLLPGMDPYATCYGGHQFGNWAGQLGDGRAINLGEVVNAHGEHWTLQLKGAGPTPYSRSADGLAVLRSSIREFLCSEAMHHLGVPTTRALSLMLTGETVIRDMLYDGHPAPEPGAVVCRVARSFTRFGHFELPASRRDTGLLRQLLDFTIRADFPELASVTPDVERYLAWFREVCQRTARLMTEWTRVGFVHGVMNTDNLSILGLTIDYGPYGWLDNYDPDWTPNTTDAGGRRYRFGHQPGIAQWNLIRLASAIHPLVGEAAPLEQILREFEPDYLQRWQSMMADKLGWRSFVAADTPLLDELHELLQATETDMTLFYRNLADLPLQPDAVRRGEVLHDAYYVPEQIGDGLRGRIDAWLERYAARVRADGDDAQRRRARMNAVNPKFVLRNYLAQLAIDAAEQGDFTMIHELQRVLQTPYDEHPGHPEWAGRRPDWARSRVGCSMLSCSS